MSDESRFNKSGLERPLRSEESALIRRLLSGVYPTAELERALTQSRVVDMQDGGMGSIRFVRSGPRSFGKALVEARYSDSDGVLVSIAVNADRQGQLFELDFWKVDFSPLIRYPKPSDVSGISIAQ
jgi:hypothetical protein